MGKAEITGRRVQARGLQGWGQPPEAGKGMEGSSPKDLRRSVALPTPCFKIPASRP